MPIFFKVFAIFLAKRLVDTIIIYTFALAIEKRGVAQSGSAPGLGPGGRRFESCRPDKQKRLFLFRRAFFAYCMLLYLFHYLDSLAALLHDIESLSIAIDLHTLQVVECCRFVGIVLYTLNGCYSSVNE